MTEKAAERAAELCRQMLAYAGKSSFALNYIDLSALVEETVSMLKCAISQNVVINMNISKDIPAIKSDTSQLRQVVMNLIINASEAIVEEHGVIHVSLARHEFTSGQLNKDHLGSVIIPGHYVCLEITDSGIGMSEETQQRVFEPFYTTKFSGRGLGMSAVLGIISAHNGALQLTSKPGQGTTFKIYLPIHDGERNSEAAFQHVDAAWRARGTILLVEDEEPVRMVAKTMLKSLGFTVYEASNGKEAIDLFQKYASHISIVVTDLGMPVMDGYTLIRELKSLKPNLPVVIATGFGDIDVTSRIARTDIAGLVGKPFNFDQLRNVLKSVVCVE